MKILIHNDSSFTPKEVSALLKTALPKSNFIYGVASKTDEATAFVYHHGINRNSHSLRLSRLLKEFDIVKTKLLPNEVKALMETTSLIYINENDNETTVIQPLLSEQEKVCFYKAIDAIFRRNTTDKNLTIPIEEELLESLSVQFLHSSSF